MQDIILGRMWADHHQRIYGDAPPRSDRFGGGHPRPAAPQAALLIVAAGFITIGAGLAIA